MSLSNLVLKFSFFVILLLTLLSLPKLTYACGTGNLQGIDPPVSCQLACGGAGPNYQGDVVFHYNDGSTCTEVRYYSDSGCGSPGTNFCPATCTDSSQCGNGTCAGAGTNATDYCNSGNTGGNPKYCQGFNCGWECTPPRSCNRNGPGQGFGGFSDQLSCTNFCKTGYECIANSCQGGVFGGTYADLGSCQASGCGAGGPTPPPPTAPPPVPTATPGPGCWNCPDYPDTWSCPVAGQTRLCHFQSQVPGCTDGGAWAVGACMGSCGPCTGGPVATVPPPVGTSPPAGTSPPCLGNGAPGCDVGGVCCPGNRCTGAGVCTSAVIRGACRMPRSVLIYPVASDPTSAVTIPGPYLLPPTPSSPNYCQLCSAPSGSQQRGDGCACTPGAADCQSSTCNSITNTCGGYSACTGTTHPPLNWRSDQRPGADCTHAADGLRAELFIDGNLVQRVFAPGYGFNGSEPNAYVTYPNPTAWSNSMAGNINVPVYAPFTPTPGVVHTWYVQYVSPNGDLGGTVPADNWPLGRFIIGAPGVSGPPPAPTLVCQAPPGSSGDIHDICDRTVSPPITPGGPPFGYGGGRDAGGNVLRYNLNALDGGPAGPRQPFYTHNYHLTDLTTGLIMPPITGPNNGPGARFTLDGRTIPLVNGHSYDWFVITTDNASPANPNPNSPPSATWRFLYDTASPTVSISSPSLCFDPITPPPNFPVNVSDPGTPTQASNIATVTATITNGAGVVVSNQNLMPSCSWGGLPPGQGVGACSVNTSGLPPTGTYTVSVTSTDNAGNSNTAITRFVYRALCIGPWLQSTGGDVHSNTGINAPGGPP